MTVNSFEFTVAAIIEKHDRFLFVEELIDGERVVNQPAGHVEAGEAPFAAVIRETLEETAWQFLPQAISGIYRWQHPHAAHEFLRVSFCGACHDHDPSRPLDKDILRAVWLTRDELLNPARQLRSPMVIRSIDDYLDGVRIPNHSIQALTPKQLAERASVVE